MNQPPSTRIPLTDLPSLAELFRLFQSGKHLNRQADAALWAELEAQEVHYRALFAALGFELRMDARGFAWFHSSEASNPISKTSRQLALLFLVIFEAQANAGRPLQRFGDWLIDRPWLEEIHKQQQELLDAEGIGPDGLLELMTRASNLGFAQPEPNGWRLLPAVFRYLDHVEALALASQQDNEENGTPDDTDLPNDEETD